MTIARKKRLSKKKKASFRVGMYWLKMRRIITYARRKRTDDSGLRVKKGLRTK